MRINALRACTCFLFFLLLGGCTEVEPSTSPALHSEEAAAVPTRFTDTVVAGELDAATAMAIAPDGRIFVCEQGGRLRLIQDGTLLSTPFLTLTTDRSGERGLLGVALDPDFPRQPYVYVYYTATTPQVHNRVSRFTANGNLAVPGSERVLLTDRAPRLDSLLGKMLRLEKDSAIPTDNPFYTRTTGSYRSIWALGLRNPFSFAVQPETGRLFINDVGANKWEEINEGVAGANYGWPGTEGPTADSRYRAPLFAYPHGSGTSSGCAISSGARRPPTCGTASTCGWRTPAGPPTTSSGTCGPGR